MQEKTRNRNRNRTLAHLRRRHLEVRQRWNGYSRRTAPPPQFLQARARLNKLCYAARAAIPRAKYISRPESHLLSCSSFIPCGESRSLRCYFSPSLSWRAAQPTKFLPAWNHSFSQFAEHRNLVLLSLFFGVIALRLAVLPLLHVPVPGIHDEYSYLLMGDTFAHGRLANPPHPMWLSLETFHVNWLPTYSSIYPPAQGAHPRYRSIARQSLDRRPAQHRRDVFRLAWMLQAWMPSRWALLGGVLAAIKFGVASYWMNSYWGGAAAAIGGALVLGALGRISKRATAWNGVVLGWGVAILANSRPYEGMLFCIPAAAWFIWWLATTRKTASTQTAASSSARIKVLVSVLIVLSATAAFMGYYNWRLTGNALLMPHSLRTRTYHSSALFLWEHSRPPLHYNNRNLKISTTAGSAKIITTPGRMYGASLKKKLTRGGTHFFWWGVILLAPGVPFVLRDKKMRLLLATIFIGALGVFAVIWSFAHYAAPFTCVIVALLVQSIRHLRTMTVATFPLGRWLSRAARPFAPYRNSILSSTPSVRPSCLDMPGRPQQSRDTKPPFAPARQTPHHRPLRTRSQHSRRMGLQRSRH